MPAQSIPQTLQIRWMIRRDMPEVMAIEKLSFRHPWREEDFLASLCQRNCVGMVGEMGPLEFGNWPKTGNIAGFMIYELHKRHLHILNFAVHSDYRRQGVGRQMLDKLKYKLAQQRRDLLQAEASEANLGAHMFFRSQGFVCTEVLRGHYDTTSEDAYLFRYAVD